MQGSHAQRQGNARADDNPWVRARTPGRRLRRSGPCQKAAAVAAAAAATAAAAAAAAADADAAAAADTDADGDCGLPALTAVRSLGRARHGPQPGGYARLLGLLIQEDVFLLREEPAAALEPAAWPRADGYEASDHGEEHPSGVVHRLVAGCSVCGPKLFPGTFAPMKSSRFRVLDRI